MKKNIITILLLVISVQFYPPEERIWGGVEIDISDVPFQVYVANSIWGDNVWACGGVILNCEYILTAAHCFDNQVLGDGKLVVVAGENSPEGEDGIEIARVIKHPLYEKGFTNAAGEIVPPVNDIAIIRLSRTLNFGRNIQPIKYATEENINPNSLDLLDLNEKVFISGWGSYEDGSESSKLRGTWIPILSNPEANIRLDEDLPVECATINNPVNNTHLSFYQNGKQAGIGDSGGSAVILTKDFEPLLVGISSFGGDGCSIEGPTLPSIYVNVLQYTDFIEGTLQGDLKYQLQDTEGNSQTAFCLEEDIYMDATASAAVERYYLELYIISENGDLNYIAGPKWVTGTLNERINLTDIWSSVNFQTGVTYGMKLAINPRECNWIEEIKIFSFFENTDLISYNFEDENNEETNEFCFGEDVYLDASETLNTGNYPGKYSMSLWIYSESNAAFEWITGTEQREHSLSEPLNITDIFENEFGINFQGNRTYKIKFSIIDEVCGQAWLEKEFTYQTAESSIAYHFQDDDKKETTEFCLGEDVYIDASESVDTGSYSMSLWIYSESNGVFEWVIGTNTIYKNLSEPINITDTFENPEDPENAITFDGDRTYAIKFAIKDPVCDQLVWLQKEFTLNDCCELNAPTNLQFDGGGTISWDPVPGAVDYIIETTPSWPKDCPCEKPIPIDSSTYGNTFFVWPIAMPNKCSSIQVFTVCADGTLSVPSDPLCVQFGTMMRQSSNVTVTSISPNPNSGRMNINVETSTDIKNITLKIQNINGVLIKKAKKFKVNNGVLNRDLDVSSQLKQGVYFFVFTIGNETITKQVIIK